MICLLTKNIWYYYFLWYVKGYALAMQNYKQGHSVNEPHFSLSVYNTHTLTHRDWKSEDWNANLVSEYRYYVKFAFHEMLNKSE